MTALCGGGPSDKKAGVQRYFNMTGSAAAAILNNVDTKFAVPLAAALASTLFDLDDFCTHDPPATPTFTINDALAFAAGFPSNPANYAITMQKVSDLVKRYAWDQLCHCTTVTTPAPTAPAPVTDWPNLAPGPTVIAQPCSTTTFTFATGQGNGTSFNRGGPTFGGLVPTAFLYHNQTEIVLAPGASIDFKWEQVDASNAVLQTNTYSLGPAGSFDATVLAKAGVASIRLTTIGTAGTGTSSETKARVDAYCGGEAPGQTLSTCCPPDPQVVQRLEQIWDYVQLLQRQIAPFASIDGSAHSGLTGNGHFDLTETLIGIRVELTTIPLSYGEAAGDPVVHFDTGFVSLGDGDQWFGERRLATTSSIWQPRWAGMASRVGYSLAPGVVATITELHREPLE